MKERWKRLLAFVIDWNLAFLLPAAAAVGLAAWASAAWGVLLAPLLIGAMALVILRDRLFGGASPGKRIFRFRVYNKKTLEPAAPGPCGVRNLFFFLLPLELVLLLATGETLGDRAAGTIVLSELSLAEHRKARAEGKSPANKLKGKHIALIALVPALWMLFTLGIAQAALQRQKDTEEYAVAYTYLLQSDAWAELDAEESEIRLTQYHLSTHHSYSSDEVTKTVLLTFRVAGRNFQVICTWVDGVWQVAEDAMEFS